MQKGPFAKAEEVREIYSGPVRELWELCMGEQIHTGGFDSSMKLATNAGIKEGSQGVDLCCCLGAGMRFLVKYLKVGKMTGVDMTESALEEAKKRATQEKLENKLEFVKGDVINIPLPDNKFDFVWGEDAWCYVEDKARLIKEAVRITKPGGIIAFTDWIEGPKGLAEEEARRINTFMKFPYVETLGGYKKLLEDNGCVVKETTDLTEEFAWCVDLYLNMLTKQHTYDALRIIGDDMAMFQAMGGEFSYLQEKAHEGKFGKGRFIAVKK